MRFLITADYGTVFATVEAPPERAVSVVIDEREHGQRRVWMQMCTVPSPHGRHNADPEDRAEIVDVVGEGERG